MEWLKGFIVYNLPASLLSGFLAWLIVLAAVRGLRLRSTGRSFRFLALPFFKSTLILLGIGVVFPWPEQVFGVWSMLAAPAVVMLPIVLVWWAMASLVLIYSVRQARRSILAGAIPAEEADGRVQAAFEKVSKQFQQAPCPECSDDFCCLVEQPLQPRVYVSGQVDTPLAIVERNEPAIVFPLGLAACLDDGELAGALAHEMAHFFMRRPVWGSTGTLQKLALISPVAGLIGRFLFQQEEKACDELVVRMLVPADVYTGMLVKSYRFAQGQKRANTSWGRGGLPSLMGNKPRLSARVENLIEGQAEGKRSAPSQALVWMVWGVVFIVLFFRWA